ncbi:MAG: cytochrome C biogenesis protein [Acidocella sp. 20-57-95]|nr:MAG: cytochrome C biogenesis protein [Acidocella sp. 20-57-95]OYV61112.1 MAG: cytochrome C biogenesis protein [Acidocella sp. 21-58-7]HQT65208.1 DsbE family thiol:disulfide interchange protein [Acidocella sp.]HQU04513.1 DsbE family thiol:disulfide interchange protein [Acidocella sp.]
MNTTRRLLFTAPLAAVALGGAAFYTILERMEANKYDPHALPSPLIGKKPPAFNLPGLNGAAGFANTDIAAPPRPMLVNWFASWCLPCAEEAPMMAQLAKTGLPIWGIAYQDNAAALANYFAQYGNPYARLALDTPGLTAINWGVYGVPETYLIDKDGIVRWRWAGAITDDVLANGLNPLLAKYS